MPLLHPVRCILGELRDGLVRLQHRRFVPNSSPATIHCFTPPCIEVTPSPL